jgi:hypothetical protein
LGKTEKIDGLEIRWPSGKTQSVQVASLNTTLKIEEP